MPRLTHTNPWQGKKVLLPPRPPPPKKMVFASRLMGRVGEPLAKVRHVLGRGRWARLRLLPAAFAPSWLTGRRAKSGHAGRSM
jgi:hypothetical protein